MENSLKELLLKELNTATDKVAYIEEVRAFLAQISPINQPIDHVRWVSVEEVEPNDYNPNSVAKIEMGLLYKSILKDGYTQPIVTIRDPETGKYVIVDGFHRYFTCKTNADIRERNLGRVPIVVIKKSINERMSATIRHNRARGSHSIQGMSNMVFKMLDNGWRDADICNELGMEVDELLRLKHVTGFSKLFENHEYRLAWETRKQMRAKKEWEAKNKG